MERAVTKLVMEGSVAQPSAATTMAAAAAALSPRTRDNLRRDELSPSTAATALFDDGDTGGLGGVGGVVKRDMQLRMTKFAKRSTELRQAARGHRALAATSSLQSKMVVAGVDAGERAAQRRKKRFYSPCTGCVGWL